jgi:hypothetical protein
LIALKVMAAVAAIGLGLLVSPVSAGNPCKLDCAKAKVACIKKARDAKTACISGGGDKATCKSTFKTAKTACVTTWKAKKPACKTDKENVNICSPSGAFLD